MALPKIIFLHYITSSSCAFENLYYMVICNHLSALTGYNVLDIAIN